MVAAFMLFSAADRVWADAIILSDVRFSRVVIDVDGFAATTDDRWVDEAFLNITTQDALGDEAYGFGSVGGGLTVSGELLAGSFRATAGSYNIAYVEAESFQDVTFLLLEPHAYTFEAFQDWSGLQGTGFATLRGPNVLHHTGAPGETVVRDGTLAAGTYRLIAGASANGRWWDRGTAIVSLALSPLSPVPVPESSTVILFWLVAIVLVIGHARLQQNQPTKHDISFPHRLPHSRR